MSNLDKISPTQDNASPQKAAGGMAGAPKSDPAPAVGIPAGGAEKIVPAAPPAGAKN